MRRQGVSSFLPGIVLLLVLAAAGVQAGQADEVTVRRDIVYGKAGDIELKLNLAVPARGNGPFPLVVCIHGGAWRAGSKTGYDGRIAQFAQKGYVGATVEYRFCPTHKFPAQVEDVKCAIRFLRTHAKEYKIDPDRVAAMGDSAGGHLSLMLGLMDPADGLDGSGGSPGVSSKVQAVVNYYGPADFVQSGTPNPLHVALVSDFTGSKEENSPVNRKASPITYVNKGDPPVLTFHGSKDPLVPLESSKRLHKALAKAGVTEHLEIIDGAGHGFNGPDSQRAQKMALEFIEKVLKAKPVGTRNPQG